MSIASSRKPPRPGQLNHPNILALGTFDIAPDGTAIVFDRLQENPDIVLIELPK